ncbi:hypothetical protein BH23ACT10_BH23ACT10_37710 [soil metagenome]
MVTGQRVRRFLELPVAVKAAKTRSWVHGAVHGHMYLDARTGLSNAIYVSGSPRSGSTWLASILCDLLRYRLIFEPIRHANDELAHFSNRFVDETEERLQLKRTVHGFLTGEVRLPYADRRNRRIIARGRIAKDVGSSLLLGWLRTTFPDLPIVFIVREPLLAVSSLMRMKWFTPRTPRFWLAQHGLMARHLNPLRGLIEASNSYVERCALEWCISNSVPLRQFRADAWVMVRYIDLFEKPRETLNRLTDYLGVPYDGSLPRSFVQPSHTAESPVPVHGMGTTTWDVKLSPSERRTVEAYVKHFALEEFLWLTDG